MRRESRVNRDANHFQAPSWAEGAARRDNKWLASLFTFVCNFSAYHVAWWKEYSSSFPDNEKCKAAGFTHVGGQVTVPNGKKAVEAQLDALVEWLDAN